MERHRQYYVLGMDIFRTFVVLVSSSTTDGANFVDNFVIRLGLILLTLLYIVVAVSILDAFWPRLAAKAK